MGQAEQPRTENLLRKVGDQVFGAAALVPDAERGGLCGEEDQLQEAVLLQRVQVRQQQPERDRRGGDAKRSDRVCSLGRFTEHKL